MRCLHFAEFHCLLHLFSIPSYCSGPFLQSYKLKNALISIYYFTLSRKIKKDKKLRLAFLKSFIKPVTPEIINDDGMKNVLSENLTFRDCQSFRFFSIYLFYLARVVSFPFLFSLLCKIVLTIDSLQRLNRD